MPNFASRYHSGISRVERDSKVGWKGPFAMPKPSGGMIGAGAGGSGWGASAACDAAVEDAVADWPSARDKPAAAAPAAPMTCNARRREIVSMGILRKGTNKFRSDGRHQKWNWS